MRTLTSSFLPRIIEELRGSNMLQDRLPGDVLTLPYTYYDIKIKPNDIVTAETINYAISLLHNNWLYLISKSVVPSNNIPDKTLATDMIVDVGNGPQWSQQSQFPALSGNTKGYALDDISNICKVDNTINASNSNYVMTTDTNVIMLSGSGTTNIDILINPIYGSNNIIISNNNITHPNNGITFESITDAIITESRELFILDDVHNSIFKFDITGMLTGDEAILYNETPGRLLVDTLGGSGKLSDKTKFSKPIAMATNNNEIYVIDHDSGTKLSVLKVYDNDLNWKGTYSLGSSLSAGPVDLEYSKKTNCLYALCHSTTFSNLSSSTIPELIEISDYTVTNTYSLLSQAVNIESIGAEKHKKLVFSVENDNMFYVLTDKSLYKKYISRPERFIGEFKFDEKNIGTREDDRSLGAIEITSHNLSINGETIVKDEMLIYDDSVSMIYRFLEDSNYERSLDTTVDYNSLDYHQLKIDPEEKVNAIVYNKFIQKLLYNNLLFLESMAKKFTTMYTSKGLSRYVGFTYLTSKELEDIQYTITLDNYVGVNEIITSATINRVLSKLYDLQLQVSSMMQERSINVYPLIDDPVLLDLS